uniref:Uncharacterized protein n=1 Tax=Glossina morsitans morsitans TaxID=37546 RepID=A0ABK9NGG1_GLOMM
MCKWFVFHSTEISLAVEPLMRFVNSPAPLTKFSESSAVDFGSRFGFFKRKTEDDKFLEIMFKSTAVVEKNLKGKKKKNMPNSKNICICT